MAYSLSLLTTWAQCDAVTAYAIAKKKMLTYHDILTDHRADNLTTSAGSITAELTSLNAFITAMTPVIATLPVGDERTKQEDQLRLKNDRRDTLMARQGEAGPEVLVQSQLDSTLVDLQEPAVQNLIDLVAAHRLTLNG